MALSLSMGFQQKNVQSIKQLQCTIMTQHMQQAINLLQASIMELSPLIEVEMEQNPVLEYSDECFDDDEEDLNQAEESIHEDSEDNEEIPETALVFDEHDFNILHRLDEDFRNYLTSDEIESSIKTTSKDKSQNFLEHSVRQSHSLFQQLIDQAREAFLTPKELSLAEFIIGNLDQSGFFTESILEVSILQNCSPKEVSRILEIIKTFTPIGIGASGLNEALLIQLRALGKEKSLTYQIIENHFDDLLHNRIPIIKKNLKCSIEQIEQTINDIAKLDLHPGAQPSIGQISYILPDISLRDDGGNLVIDLNEDSIPRLRINKKYLRMLENENIDIETKDFIRQKIASAKWLLRNLLERSDTIYRITESLLKRQHIFFHNPDGMLTPLTMKIVADDLELHESTIARAISNKYIETPRGLLPFRFFFTPGLLTTQGEEVSTNLAKQMIKELIAAEDSKKPFSDEMISRLICEKGIKCARRTVAKYRTTLNIGSAMQRKKY